MSERVLSAQRRSIAIIGMPGSGKTTVGRELARISGRPFFDTDRMIKEKYAKSPGEIITELGEAYFRDLESACLKEAVLTPLCVISTGGGIVTRQDNFKPLKDNCFVIQITRPLDALYIKNRPLSLLWGVERLFRERAPIYEAWADATVENRDSLETARIINNSWLIHSN